MPSHYGVSAGRNLDPILAAFRFQRDGLTGNSPLYYRLLGVAIDDAERQGICAEVLAKAPEGVEPVLDALPLRFLGGVHQLVLDGEAPDLARHYPSAGGHFDPDDPTVDPDPVFLATVAERRDRIVESLARTVQTNEVGRCASLLPGFLEVAQSTGLPLRVARARHERRPEPALGSVPLRGGSGRLGMGQRGRRAALHGCVCRAVAPARLRGGGRRTAGMRSQSHRRRERGRTPAAAVVRVAGSARTLRRARMPLSPSRRRCRPRSTEPTPPSG